MRNLYKIIIVFACGLMSLSFFLPLWKITIWAPQYPEGLSMQIWSHKFSGDVQTINILNHYIGMQMIQESSFPELKYFPTVFGVLIIFGLVVAFLNSKKLIYLWTVSVLSFAIWGLYDFWKWEYNFGHNLNPDAAIKMDDMTYQPPLIGTKEFLNIQASSWPDLAGYGFAISVVLGIGISLSLLLDRKKIVEN